MSGTSGRCCGFWTAAAGSILLPELLADLNSGHSIVATVFEECRSMYRGDGPVEMRPVGEVEFVTRQRRRWNARRKATNPKLNSALFVI